MTNNRVTHGVCVCVETDGREVTLPFFVLAANAGGGRVRKVKISPIYIYEFVKY